jgi:glycosyltransferase involved in cell wall biosynthesis
MGSGGNSWRGLLKMADVTEITMPSLAGYAERLLSSKTSRRDPLSLTIAIPQYKHREYLEVVLQSIFNQKSTQFDILISDDCSPDDSNKIIPALLETSGRPYRYYAQEKNLGYDRNVRFCLRAAPAPYVMLLGNDDALANEHVVDRLVSGLRQISWPEVTVTNYRQWHDDSSPIKRVFTTELIGSGPSVALANFRMFSFVSGLIYSREAALAHETDRWDCSIYYQIYLACRILAAGGRLGAIDCVAVAKDVKVKGKGVPSYTTKHRNEPWSFQPHDGGLLSVMRVATDAVMPYVAVEKRSQVTGAAIRQMLSTSYLFWLVEYRRVANWAFAFGLARALWPSRAFAEYRLNVMHRPPIWLGYSFVTIIGLLAPVSVLRRLKHRVANLIRARQQRSHVG